MRLSKLFGLTGCATLGLFCALAAAATPAHGLELQEANTLQTALQPRGWHTESVLSSYWRYTCPNGIIGHSYDMDRTYRTLTFANGFKRTDTRTGKKKSVLYPCDCVNAAFAYEYTCHYTVN